MPAHGTRRIVVCFLFLFASLAQPVLAGPELSIDTTEEVIAVPIGTVSSNTLPVFNSGDATLNWTLMDKFQGKVVKSFDNPWTSAKSIRYDSTRNCLWLAYYYNHISYGDNGVWYGAYYTPKNQVKKFDPAMGKIRRVIEMPDWYESGYIYDQSFESPGRLWTLTYRHDYHVT